MPRKAKTASHSPVVWAAAIVIVIVFTAVAYRVVTQCESSTFQVMKYIQVQLGGCKLNEVSTKTPEWRIYFEYDKSTPNASGLATIEDAYQWFYQHPGKKILVEGHASVEDGPRQSLDETEEDPGRPTAAYAQKLSERRAIAVRDVLIHRGVLGNKVDVLGYGLSKPISSGTEFSDAKNRRVEIKMENDEDVRTN